MGASALGFNFYSQSPRFVEPEHAANIADGLTTLRAGVFVNEAPARILEIVSIARLDIVQLHGEERADGLPSGLRIWKAFRVGDGWSPALLDEYPAEAFLLDGPEPGSGESFDWRMARNLPHRIVLAGGLGPDNVADAIRTVRPWGVDACSRLESSPGHKDQKTMRRFIDAALLESTP